MISFHAAAKFIVSYVRFWGRITQSGRNASGHQDPMSQEGRSQRAAQIEGTALLRSPSFCLVKCGSQPMWFGWADPIISSWNGPFYELKSMSTCSLPAHGLGHKIRTQTRRLQEERSSFARLEQENV